MPNNEELVLEMVSALMDGLRESFITDVLKGMGRGDAAVSPRDQAIPGINQGFQCGVIHCWVFFLSSLI